MGTSGQGLFGPQTIDTNGLLLFWTPDYFCYYATDWCEAAFWSSMALKSARLASFPIDLSKSGHSTQRSQSKTPTAM